MRGVYEANGKATVSAAKTLLYITVGAAICVEVLDAWVTNAGNETNEQLETYFKKIGTLGTPTATTLTPSKQEQGDQAAASTVKFNVTASEPTYTSNTELGYEGFPSLGGYKTTKIPEVRPVLAPSASWGIYLPVTPTSLDLVVGFVFREMG